MNDGRPGAPNVLETTRVRAGGSAKLAAVAITAVLGLVAWIGIAGRATPVVPASGAPDFAQVPSASPPASAQAVTTPEAPASPTPGPTPTSPSAIAAIERDDLIVVATIGRRQFMTWLRPVKPGHLSGTFRLPIPPPATAGTLELEQVWRTVAQAWRTPSRDPWATLGTWDLHLESLSAASGREYVLLDRLVRAQPMERDLSQLVTRGYRITVRAQSGLPLGLVTVDVQLARSVIEGNDGIFGWPVVAQLGSERRAHWIGEPVRTTR